MSNHGMFAAHKLLKHQVWDDHGMFTAHKSWVCIIAEMTSMGWHKYNA